MTTETAAPEAPEAAAAAPATMLSGDASAATAAPETAAAAAAATPEATAAETAKPEGEKPAEEGKPAGAPEKYELTPAEGQSFSPEAIGALEEVARELNLDNASAQKVVDKIAPALAQAQQQAVDRASAEWVAQVQADKEIGGDKLQDSLVAARQALDQFGTPGLRELLDSSRLGNHPEIIKLLAKAGKAISPDTSFVGGKPAPAEAKSTAQVLYPNQ